MQDREEVGERLQACRHEDEGRFCAVDDDDERCEEDRHCERTTEVSCGEETSARGRQGRGGALVKPTRVPNEASVLGQTPQQVPLREAGKEARVSSGSTLSIERATLTLWRRTRPVCDEERQCWTRRVREKREETNLGILQRAHRRAHRLEVLEAHREQCRKALPTECK